MQYSAMTGQSLFYMGESDLAHKILAIVEEEGAERASYALKLLQSEGELTIASTGKDPATGRLVTQEYRVEGPVMIFLTTTAIEVDEELLNRCIVLTVDEGREQTRAIHERQREAQTLGGCWAAGAAVMELHQNAQRLLRPLSVVNPYAEELTFPGSPDAHAARSHEVSGADRRDRAAAPVPAAGEGGGAPGRETSVHRGDEGRHRAGEPADAGGAGPKPGRAAAADEALARSRRRFRDGGDEASRVDRCDYRFQPAGAAGLDGLGQHAAARAPWPHCWSSSTCWCTAGVRAKATCTSFAAQQARPGTSFAGGRRGGG